MTACRLWWPLAWAAALAPGLRADPPPAADSPLRAWHADWITHPAAPLREPLVLHFRRTWVLPAAPSSYWVRVSADNRFLLHVNGRRVGEGPARADLAHWRYERFDLAPYLRPGANVIAATVWNFGILAPLAQMSDRTAFLLESEAASPLDISTPAGWQVEIEAGRRALPRPPDFPRQYWAAGPGEQLDAGAFDWAWDQPGSGPAWTAADSPMREEVFAAESSRAHSADETGDNSWGLTEDRLPPMEYAAASPGRVVRVDGGPPDLARFPGAPVTVPAAAHVHLLFDRRTLFTAFPELTVSGGRGARIRLTYAEALVDAQGRKGDRDAIAGRRAVGLQDLFLPDGGERRTFRPLWWRAWRYLDCEIDTAEAPLTLDSLRAWETGYPFRARARFDSGDPGLARIWDISWRTARVNAHETYSDTPYYEQLQYIGDTRIQALISFAVADDDRLARQALEAFAASRLPCGLTQSRYPSSLPQIIPTFSLLWVGMVHDWWMNRPDPAPARDALPGIRAVLAWFGEHERPDGLLGRLPWWSFIDWLPSGELPTYGAGGESCTTTLEYLGALEDAADLEGHLGDPRQAREDRDRADRIRIGLRRRGWNSARGLLADNPDQLQFSQQTNVLAVLYDVIPPERRRDVLRRMLAIAPGSIRPDGVLSASYYFRFYLARALEHAGMADDYLASLQPWRDLLALHFSTWPEIPGNTRSDSHGWSAHPIYDLLRLVAGIAPGSPGFGTVRIAPHLGPLRTLAASYPHPEGAITVSYRRTGRGLDATLTLPGTLTGVFEYAGQTRGLHPGTNRLSVPGP
ncbi:MAG TPA: alpha-L-rhamnosidase C-terminal domain-containing protein [Opitutaceae bacterium]|nr:alpha-L-rhamnosidase C-terminal domain-containing protein [Opitutaceae bacterium]